MVNYIPPDITLLKTEHGAIIVFLHIPPDIHLHIILKKLSYNSFKTNTSLI